MTLRESLRVVWRWRSIIVAGALLGVIVGWASAPGTAAPITAFQATHTLILKPGRSVETPRLTEVLATLGPVPDRVAARLHLDPGLVKSAVSAEARDPGLLLISSRSTDRAEAEALANVTAEELIVYLGGQNSPLETLEPAVASPVEADQIQGPRSRPGRALMLGAFGLVLGVGAAFGVERFDNRIRSKPAAEEALGVPVMAEVPTLPRSNRGRMLTEPQPSSFVEAYRGLRTIVDRWSIRTGNEGGHRVVVVVTSPTGGEGTTTTVAHLAATLGEIGRSVVVISADLRHPRLHLYFGRPREPGLTDILRGAPDVRQLTDLNLRTTTPGVRFVSSGAPVRNPAPLLDHIGDHLRAARSMGDFVLVDAPPLLTTSDGADLARHADGVLLVVRAGHTSTGAASRSVELLERLDIPVLGAVLVGSDASAVRT
jgi:Mrp family chromosome partitioning ATPase